MCVCVCVCVCVRVLTVCGARTVERARVRVRHMQEELLAQRSLLQTHRDSLRNAKALLERRSTCVWKTHVRVVKDA